MKTIYENSYGGFNYYFQLWWRLLVFVENKHIEEVLHS